MSPTKSFLVLGCGSIGARHIRNLISDGHFVAAWNRSPKRLTSIAKEYKIPTYNSLDQALKNHYDCVYVCTPNSLHADHSVEVARRGLNLFIEKPVATESQSAEMVMGLIISKNLSAYVGCNMRFHRPSAYQISP